MQQLRLLTLIPALLSVLLLAVAACGGSGSNGNPAANSHTLQRG